MFWLKSTSLCPPGEFWYRQTAGISMTFPPNPSISELAGQVTAFRRANALPGADLSQAYQDIVIFTCDRLNNDPAWCMDLDLNPADLVPATTAGCGTCGAVVK